MRERSSGIGESVAPCGGSEVGSAAAVTCSPPESTGTGTGGSEAARSLAIGDCGLAAIGGRLPSDFFRGVSKSPEGIAGGGVEGRSCNAAGSEETGDVLASVDTCSGTGDTCG